MPPLTLTPKQLSLNTATLGPNASLEDAVRGCVKYGFGGIAPWRDKVAEVGLAQACRLIKEAGLTVSGLCRGGLFPAADRSAREKIRADNLRAIEEAAALEAACLVLVVGGLPAGDKDLDGARRQVEDGIVQMLALARHLLTDRGMMGDGVIDLPRLCQRVADDGYRGLYEVEIFSADAWWRQPVDVTLSTIIQRLPALGSKEDRNENR
ncbi:MAG: sugar phosphate isomerase/epimerase family protein [Sodalis sp. (in: enterobacteria)]|uniref:sugar phosphate isomerase/epimerase family protein n=1 Tax=Sodalis sp. (in: enterobacteria) TaxID=1898979 RepID=UPI003FD84F85